MWSHHQLLGGWFPIVLEDKGLGFLRPLVARRPDEGWVGQLVGLSEGEAVEPGGHVRVTLAQYRGGGARTWLREHI